MLTSAFKPAGKVAIGRRPTEVVLAEVAQESGVAIAEIVGRSRVRHVVDARQAVAERLRTQCGMSYGQIGQILDGRDHTTVMHLMSRQGLNGRRRTVETPVDKPVDNDP